MKSKFSGKDHLLLRAVKRRCVGRCCIEMLPVNPACWFNGTTHPTGDSWSNERFIHSSDVETDSERHCLFTWFDIGRFLKVQGGALFTRQKKGWDPSKKVVTDNVVGESGELSRRWRQYLNLVCMHFLRQQWSENATC